MTIYFLHLFVHGKVQGVFFRKYTQKAALEIGTIRGMVRNLDDNRTVEVMAFSEDKEKLLDKFANWCCTKGSPKSVIESSKVVVSGEFVPNEYLQNATVMKAFQTKSFEVWKLPYDF